MSQRQLVGWAVAMTLAVGVSTAQAAGLSYKKDDSVTPPLTPPPASVWDAYFSADGGYNWNTVKSPSSPNQSVKDYLFGARASGAYNLPSGVGIQADLTYNRDYLEHNPDFYFGDTDGAVHLYWRDPNRGLIGAIGQFGQTSTSFAYAGPFGSAFDRYYGGLEAQAFLGKLTLYGQLAYESTHADLFPIYTVDGRGWVTTAQARYFLQPNWMVYGKAQYTDIKVDISGIAANLDNSAWALGLGTEYRPSDSPFSFFASVQWGANKTSNAGYYYTFDTTKVLAGLKLNLGTKTLIERDRNGASLDPLPATHTLLFP